jgi:hypothetical protein
MKKTILALSAFLFAASAFAQINNVSKEFSTRAFELLAKNHAKITLNGDVHKGEKLKPIISDIGEYVFSSFYLSGHERENQRIRSVSSTCEMYPRGIAAKCTLIVQYNPLGETAISYIVGLDNNKMPVSIMENRANVSRGD